MANANSGRSSPTGIRALLEEEQTLEGAGRAQENLLQEGRPAAYAAVLRDGALSYGVGVRSTAPYLVRAQQEGFPTVRRSSGGTGVVTGSGDVLWGLVLPRDHPGVGRDFVRAYARLGRGPVSLLASHGVAAGWEAAPGLSEEYCPLSSRGYVLVHAGKVLGAAAQHLTGRALLHHGFLGRRVDRPLVDRLFGFPDPGPSARLAGWEEALPSLSPTEVAHGIVRALSESLGPGP